ncbi:SWIM zinc finger family protein [Candidatus Chloroploca sp. M-50]|uniref:SWIM zinc finger family protein n=1 Tax=Candidatus Chloroploca mongolica TaxID=2528176 RepID=A0ABS4DC65_9CHLR|nr:SWIM zinc finger family protein [Candidatus Chloroploca mongolica]MBP1467027.1 SWIM zinc finger family protein [Candidatus Chloroploca mongolica]
MHDDQIAAMAPDAASLTAARKLALPKLWPNLGTHSRALWGECQGSGANPYRVQVDLETLAFRCSCPSRKLPCKHTLALMLLLANQADQVPVAELPDWVAEWLAQRARTAERRQVSAEAAPIAASAAPEPPPSRTPTAREQRVAAGMLELDRWLEDRVRTGLAGLQEGALGLFAPFASRMVDAQAPGVARRLREAALLPGSGVGWEGRLLDQLSLLHLLARAYAHLDDLPPDLQADVRTTIGFTQSQEELLAGQGIFDQWLVLGRRIEDEERLRVQRTWLWGMTEQRPALVLSFSVAEKPFDQSLVPGSFFAGELVFYPGSVPQRALVRTREELVPEPGPLPGWSINAAIGIYAAALAQQPWLERHLLIIGPCRLACAEDRWYLCDADDQTLPLSRTSTQIWQLLALTGGHPFTIVGEWDGGMLLPLSVQCEGGFFCL